MAKLSTVSTYKEPTTASLSFAEKSKVQPVGFEGLGIDQDVTVTLKGKVTRLASHEWDKSKSVTVELTECAFTVPVEKPVTMDSAISDAAKTRKKVR
jgi:hypothetical protein